ncbi:MAG: hypothetical protein R3D67_05510 [Hyphomicrobiaceae bacterium]
MLFVSSLVWLFAIPWTAFSLAWEVMALQGWFSGKTPPSGMLLLFGIVFPLFGVPFVAIGLAMMGTPLWAWWSARHTAHVVGEKRIATITVGRDLKVKTWATSAILRTERAQRRNGSGTLKIILGRRKDSDGDVVEETETLYGIADVAEVERRVQAAQGHTRQDG